MASTVASKEPATAIQHIFKADFRGFLQKNDVMLRHDQGRDRHHFRTVNGKAYADTLHLPALISFLRDRF
jgi:hypothetical protein